MTERRIDLRPWIAALLGSIVTGLGHLYLRRVRRAVGWLAAAVLTVFIWAPDPMGASPLEFVPSMAVVTLSVLDAFTVALLERRKGRATRDTETVNCPACGRPLDLELDFCPWCTTRFERFEVREVEE